MTRGQEFVFCVALKMAENQESCELRGVKVTVVASKIFTRLSTLAEASIFASLSNATRGCVMLNRVTQREPQKKEAVTVNG